mmetsp:Transcript_16957/g.51091  ORF Transcript_16957/g.51091 Transcript_16957/m.51091 type:complete len:257 (-) Transcript_16957:104-874(-)
MQPALQQPRPKPGWQPSVPPMPCREDGIAPCSRSTAWVHGLRPQWNAAEYGRMRVLASVGRKTPIRAQLLGAVGRCSAAPRSASGTSSTPVSCSARATACASGASLPRSSSSGVWRRAARSEGGSAAARPHSWSCSQSAADQHAPLRERLTLSSALTPSTARGTRVATSQRSDAEPTSALVARSTYKDGRPAAQPGSRLHRSHAPTMQWSTVAERHQSSTCSPATLRHSSGHTPAVHAKGALAAMPPAASQTKASE